ncbi:MAG TPA: Fe-S cluster assembly protein SufD [Acidimicrobiia bacterium]|nr:Fe-S cluster assembly protein SufD [Acidimicrobiia bacterium]
MADGFDLDVARSLPGPDWLAARRAEAASRLAELAWPSASEEIWRYSPIDRFDPSRYRPDVTPPPQWGGLDPAITSKGVVVGTLDAVDDATARELLGTCANESPDAFTALHDAFLTGGAFVHVPAGVVVEDPIVVDHASFGDGRAVFPHTLVVLDEGAEATVLERSSSDGEDRLVVPVVELVVGQAAHLRFLSVQQHGASTWQIALQRAHVGRDATLRSSAIALGGDYARVRSEALLAGDGADSDVLAVYFGDGDQTLDFRTLQDHAAPHTRSNLLFKGAVEDRAHSVYSGLVRIRRHAQRSDAFQTNRNLVLTEGAGAESIPNLEIEADDVRCSHASAVGPIDEDQLYYLETRGVPPADAQRLIVLGFFDDVFDRLAVPALVEPLRGAVDEKVGRLTTGV